MNAIFHEYIGKFMEVYIDDVMVKSISVNQHIDHLRKAFVTMRRKGLKMNPLKCAFGVSAGNFLGFVVLKKEIVIDKNKAGAILALSAPKSKKEVQSFFGKVNYLRRFISNLSDRTRVFAPLVKLKNDLQFEWTNEHQLAFDSIKAYLSKAPIMANVRPHEPLKLYIVASRNTIGFKAVKGHVIADFLVDNSKDLNDQGTNVIDVKVNYWKLYFDGSKHKDGAGVRILIVSPEGIPSEFLIGPETLKKLASVHQILVLASEREVLCIDEWEDTDWRKPIAQYLKDPNIPVDRKMKLQAINFVLMADELYKKGIDGTSRNINMITSTPYYAQANGHVDAANKILISLIKKHIGNKPRMWHDTLSQVQWAYRNSPRGSTNTSPYKLVYGHDAVLPLEINLNTLRVSKQNDLPVDDYWNAMFDELNELDSERILAFENMVRQKQSIAQSYNRRIKEKSFSIGELVLKVILPMEKKSKFLSK
ncbi:uncharacterized protein [Arachis hypogaea]|uniref:uncharacterized protein n=1 Tax=Arachis hypogaea TaxID=3818 RepID=UPI003B2232DF